MAIIQFKDVWEMYRINFIIDGRSTWDNFWALKELTFNIEKGETVGIIGENGAGKSTILKLIAGMLKADRGEVIVSGRVSGLLELGSGFQPELTGKDNIYLNASLFGLKKDEIEKKYEEIVSFVDIGRFIHAPVKCYSQGMFVRLAFAIAIHVDPDILLIDDSLSVGDEYFQRKCIKKIFEIKEQGKTIIFVTHDMNMLSRLCDRAIFIKEGRIVKDDSKDKVIPLYSQMVGEGRGVAVLNRGSLSLVFNNGRLLLNWKNKLITPNSGAHTVLRIADVWYHSSQADWQVSRESENKIVCIGTFYHLAIKQIWEIELLGSLDINIDIEIYSQQDAYIQEGSMSILLSCEYNKWLTSLESGDFPNIEHHN
ncbi:MAG: ABC transporter ATP-binding protein, partial [Candidatus Omnitrophica bacterium]|nr:ABC transporter ATP-binding protein [Candidatus Omnitrophota bacterium]